MTEVIKSIERFIARLTQVVTNVCLLMIVIVVLYSVVLRYVFSEPPFWSDRIGVFANMTMILLGLSLTVRNRELVAMQAVYEKVARRTALRLEALWNTMILAFSAMFIWYGLEAALTMPGQYWDFQDFCIDVGFGESENQGAIYKAFKSLEGLVAAAVKPFCVDGAVPQRYLAYLMPISGLLLLIASIGIVIKDMKALRTESAQNQT